MTALALARGGVPVAVRTTAFGARPLAALALENAVEGQRCSSSRARARLHPIPS